MSYDLKAFCEDLDAKLTWVLKEVQRLQQENERLVQENQALREEVTLSRMLREAEHDAASPFARPRSESSEPLMLSTPTALPPKVQAFFANLPDAFNFDEFFSLAEMDGIDNEEAKQILLLLLRKNLVVQRGPRIEKVHRATKAYWLM